MKLMNRRLSLLGLTIYVAGCASASQPGTSDHDPAGETRIDPAPALTGLEGLGITERVVVQPDAAQRLVSGAITGISGELATCFRSSLDRDPKLTGAITYGVRLGAGSGNTDKVSKKGDLASLPSAECARRVLEKISIPAASSEVHAFYTVTFGGTYRPKPLPEAGHRMSTWSADWDDEDGKAPDGFERPAFNDSDAFRRCAIGAEPVRLTPSWVVMNVGTDGSATLDDAGSKDDETDLCIRRQLGRVRFPKHTRPVAVSMLFLPSAPVAQKPAAEESTEGEDSAFAGLSGDAMGLGGLGTGIANPGGGGGTGMGIGSIGALGHGTGTGTGQGFGSGRGRLGGSHSTKPPKVKAGSATVGPKYPPEVIQRIVRQNFGRFRLCYENGLRKDPNLEGRVEVSFTIGRDGSVTTAKGAGTMPDKGVMSCVAKAFSTLKFPAPDGGVIKVMYPILFSPDGEFPDPSPPAKAAKKSAIPSIDGKPLHEVELAQIALRLEKLGYQARVVPAAQGAAAPPVVFYQRGLDDAGHVRLTKTGSKPVGDCRRSEGGVSLTVRKHDGDCAPLTSRLFD
ncbi:MAG: energy transducer TonB [Polyangiaceae bacterium]|nr:energy transducer TonB [Polyangiaceae bacterium]